MQTKVGATTTHSLINNNTLCTLRSRCAGDLASSLIIVPAFPSQRVRAVRHSPPSIIQPSSGRNQAATFKRPMAVQSKISRIGPSPSLGITTHLCAIGLDRKPMLRKPYPASEAWSTLLEKTWRINRQISTHQKATPCTDHVPDRNCPYPIQLFFLVF